MRSYRPGSGSFAASAAPARPPKRLRIDGQGSAIVEFALIAPAFLLFLMAILGAGLGGFYQLSLDDAVRDAARQIQIGGPASTSGAQFAAAVCTQFGSIAPNCTANLTYNVQTNTPPANFAALTPLAMPPGGAFVNAFPTFPSNANVLVQVAYPLPFVMPLIGSAITFTGTNSILSTTTVRMEPHN